MYEKLLPLAALVMAGAVVARQPSWRDGTARRAVAGLVIGVFAPALVVDVVLRAPVSGALAGIVVAGWVAVGGSALVGLALLRACGRNLSPAQVGALALAAVFGNGMGMALPVTEALLGPALGHVPLTYDLLVTVPLVWTVGVLVAARCGGVAPAALGRELLRLPPFLALVAALAWRLGGVPVPDLLLDITALPARAAAPMLALLVGLALRWPGRDVSVRWVGAAVLVRVMVAPALALGAGIALDLAPAARTAVALTAAAPSVIVGVALCERYRLDAGLFGAVLAATTAAYLLVAPWWARLAGGL